MSRDKCILVTDYPVARYEYGLTVGDRVRLKNDLIAREHRNLPTEKNHRKGEIRIVLRGQMSEE